MPISPDPKTGLGQFFEGIWGVDKPGFVYLPTKDSRGIWKKSFFEWPKHKAHVINHVLYASSATKDVYFSPVIWSIPKMQREYILGSYVLWADFDGNAPDPDQWTDRTSQPVHEAHSAAPGPPSVVVQSSTETHQHVYWRLDEFATAHAFIENTNRAIAYSYSADTSGWDLEQILRPPFSTNYKHELPVLVSSFHTSASYSADAFASFKPVKQLIDESVDETNLPNAVELLGRYSWDAESLDLINKDVSGIDRSSALMRIGYKCAELGLTDAECLSMLFYMDDKLGKFKNRSDRKKRLLDIVNKARQKHPHKLEELEFSGLSAAVAEVNSQYIFGFKSFLQADFRVEWAIDNLMPVGGMGIIVSPPNIGKTQLMSQFAIHQALAKPFIGYQFNRPRKGIFFSLEMGPAGYLQFSTSLVQDHTTELDLLEKQLLIVPLGEPMPLMSNSVANKFFESIVIEHQPDFVAFDSLQMVVTGKMDDENIRAFFNYMASIRQKYNLYVWIIHHSRKAQGENKKPNKLEDLYGSQYIAASIDTALSLWETAPDTIEVTEIKNRYAQKAKPFIIKRTSTLNFIRADSVEMAGLDNAARLDIGNPLGTVGGGQTNKLGFSF